MLYGVPIRQPGIYAAYSDCIAIVVSTLSGLQLNDISAQGTQNPARTWPYPPKPPVYHPDSLERHIWHYFNPFCKLPMVMAALDFCASQRHTHGIIWSSFTVVIASLRSICLSKPCQAFIKGLMVPEDAMISHH
jgi:hypothetical protein